MSDNLRWVYHPTQEAKVVTNDEAYKLYEDGWYDTPAKFPKAGEEKKVEVVEISEPKGLPGNDSEVSIEAKKRGRPPRVA